MPTEHLPNFCPKNQSDWRQWLAKNHQTSQSIWVIFYKLSSNKANLSWSQAVDEALCFGWIDSVKKTLDDERYIQFFSQRKAKSNWSKINKKKVDALIANNQMKAAGLKSIEVAKENGSWSVLDEVEALIIPKELEKALNDNSKAKDYYLSLSNSSKKILLYWVHSAKRPETKQKRISEIIENASQGLMPIK